MSAISKNLQFYKSKLKPDTKVMAMVKASAYGLGSVPISKHLEKDKVDYLGVAYTHEGIILREGGVKMPIMVMNPNIYSFDQIVKYDLEPAVYSLDLLKEWANYYKENQANVLTHLKIDSGMNRLGFAKQEMAEVAGIVNDQKLQIGSFFSHLSAADDTNDLAFTAMQVSHFQDICNELEQKIYQNPFRHISNSSAIISYPEAQLDMVRLGIGLYGYDPVENCILEIVANLYAQISQVKFVEKGDSVGYSRAFIAHKKTKIAIVNIGYADGVSRQLSKGKGKVYVNGVSAPVVGNVCMDMLIIDVTNVECSEGDQVEIFGEHITIEMMAKWLKTIPYEILTSVSERVKRIYVHD